MSNITVNTDCIETVIEMINRCAVEFDSDVSSLLDTTFAPLVNAGLCGNIAGELKAQCQTLDNNLGICSIKLANFLTDYVIEEKELEAYCNSLPQESSMIESILSTESFGFTSLPNTTSIESIDKGRSISKDDNTNNQNLELNTSKIKEEILVDVSNDNNLNEQKINDDYKIKSENLKNINNYHDTIKQDSEMLFDNIIEKTTLHSMENNSVQNTDNLIIDK